MPNKQKRGGAGIGLFLTLGLLMCAFYLLNSMNTGDVPTYQEILSYFDNQQVQSYVLDFGSGELQLKILNDQNKEEHILYQVPSVSHFVQYTEPLVEAYNAEHTAKPIEYDYLPADDLPWWLSMLPTIILIVGMVFLWVFMARQSGGGSKMSNFGKAKPRMLNVDAEKTLFSDVAGADEEKEELKEIVQFLKNPAQFNALGARIPKGVLLIGPPGTG
ncbi:MAG: ATP-dependent zinc metalloprotease FtsH, partial [Oscillospiraceae bacterium]|nr:ATP-dependent zinc metalloprotease FtsH [Oscillospiraceae bacterium]